MVTKSKGSSVQYGMSRYSKAKVPTDLGRPYVKYQGGGDMKLDPKKEYEDFLEHLKKARTAIGKNDTKTLRELSFGKLPYGPNELSKDYVRAQELRKAAGLGLKDDVNLALPHLSQQIRGTANKVLGTHYKYGGSVKKYGDGGQLGAGAFSGAATGMSMGSVAGPIGMGVGAVIGGITGLLTTKKRLQEEKELKEQEERERKRGEAMIQKDYSNAVLSSFPTTGIRTQSFYGMGGAMKRYQGGGEMEGLGSSQMPAMMPPGSAEENTYMSSMTDGPTHEQGGIPIPELGAELEGGELVEDKPDGFYVYSKRIKIDPTPYKKFMK